MELVRVERDDGIAVVTLDRPDRLNALSASLISELRAVLADLRYDRDVSVIVLTGAGKGFCAGADLTARHDHAPDAEGRGRIGHIWRTQQHVAGLIVDIYEHPKPIVTAIHGPAVGGGLAIALASDLRVATPTAKFGAVFINIGLSSCDVGVSYLLPKIVGVTRASELMLTGRHFSGQDAHEFGMLNALAADGEHLIVALSLAREVAKQHEYGLELTKSGLHAALDSPSLRHAVEMENRTQALGSFGNNAAEAVRAFGERRAPEWSPM
jgi:enoyl-CoA hydratase